MVKNKPIDVAFWEKVKIGASWECWPWLGSRDSQGYGVWTLHPNNRYAAHRLAFEFTFGSIDDPDMNVHHNCENILCCNPGHLKAKNDVEHVLWHDRERSRILVQLYGRMELRGDGSGSA